MAGGGIINKSEMRGTVPPLLREYNQLFGRNPLVMPQASVSECRHHVRMHMHVYININVHVIVLYAQACIRTRKRDTDRDIPTLRSKLSPSTSNVYCKYVHTILKQYRHLSCRMKPRYMGA